LRKDAISDEASVLIGDFSRQALHAAVLGFVHPVTGEEMRFSADLPSDMEALISALHTNS
jgi:23S rRNA pseudouridine1911/1915/1917 synthase